MELILGIVVILVVVLIAFLFIKKRQAPLEEKPILPPTTNYKTATPADTHRTPTQVAHSALNKEANADVLAVADSLIDEQRYDEVIAQLKRHLMTHPNHAQAMLKLLQVYGITNNHNAFRQLHQKIHEIADPETIRQADFCLSLLEDNAGQSSQATRTAHSTAATADHHTAFDNNAFDDNAFDSAIDNNAFNDNADTGNFELTDIDDDDDDILDLSFDELATEDSFAIADTQKPSPNLQSDELQLDDALFDLSLDDEMGGDKLDFNRQNDQVISKPKNNALADERLGGLELGQSDDSFDLDSLAFDSPTSSPQANTPADSLDNGLDGLDDSLNFDDFDSLNDSTLDVLGSDLDSNKSLDLDNSLNLDDDLGLDDGLGLDKSGLDNSLDLDDDLSLDDSLNLGDGLGLDDSLTLDNQLLDDGLGLDDNLGLDDSLNLDDSLDFNADSTSTVSLDNEFNFDDNLAFDEPTGLADGIAEQDIINDTADKPNQAQMSDISDDFAFDTADLTESDFGTSDFDDKASFDMDDKASVDEIGFDDEFAFDDSTQADGFEFDLSDDLPSSPAKSEPSPSSDTKSDFAFNLDDTKETSTLGADDLDLNFASTSTQSTDKPAFGDTQTQQPATQDLNSIQITLSLAEQYLNLGEHDSARRLLEEVVNLASDEEQQKAQILLDRLA